MDANKARAMTNNSRDSVSIDKIIPKIEVAAKAGEDCINYELAGNEKKFATDLIRRLITLGYKVKRENGSDQRDIVWRTRRTRRELWSKIEIMKRELNLPLFEEIKKKIVAEPKFFDLATFGDQRACGTSHCIGGWAVVLGDPGWFGENKGTMLSERAMMLLGLNYEQASQLFYGWERTDEDIEAFQRSKTGTIYYARSGVAFIDRCIAQFQKENYETRT